MEIFMWMFYSDFIFLRHHRHRRPCRCRRRCRSHCRPFDSICVAVLSIFRYILHTQYHQIVYISYIHPSLHNQFNKATKNLNRTNTQIEQSKQLTFFLLLILWQICEHCSHKKFERNYRKSRPIISNCIVQKKKLLFNVRPQKDMKKIS